MNTCSLWTTIVSKAPCAFRQASRKPLLQPFRSYASSQRLLCRPTPPGPIGLKTAAGREAQWHQSFHSKARQAFATTATLSKRGGRSPYTPPSNPKILADAKLEPAPTLASHTEGVNSHEGQLEEELTWRDYDPAGGMPLPQGERSQSEISTIFGDEVLDADTGNYILSVMHWRRMSGALIDSGLGFARESGVSREQALMGLEYVRKLAPQFDEREAGQRWAEEETQRLQNDLRDRALKLRLYKPEEEPEPLQEEVEEMQGTQYGRERSGESVLQITRREKEAQFAQEQAEKAAAEQKAQITALHAERGPLNLGGGVQPEIHEYTDSTGGLAITRPRTEASLQSVERSDWVKYYEEQALLIKDNTIPQLSVFRRLVPSFLMTLVVFGLCIFLSDNYTPPPTSARIWPDTPPAVATLTAVTGTLVAFFLLGRVPPLWRAYSKYFTLVPVYPNAISIVGSTFRHNALAHLATNVISLWLFGLLLHEDVGRGTFLSIFLAAGAGGSFASLTYNVLRKQWMAYVFGSSTGVLGVVAAACTLRPNGTVHAFGYEIPIAAWVILALYGVAEATAAIRMRKTSIDHAGHVGGMITGIAAGLWLRRKAGQNIDVINEITRGDSDRGEEKRDL